MNIKGYYLLFIAGLFSVIVIPFFMPYGGLVGDSHHYFRLAHYFPEVKWSIFPLGYPFLIKLFYSITGDYFFAARLINIFCYLAIGVFSYYKGFFFKETVILLCTKIFFYIFFLTLPEGLFLTLMYFLFYFFYTYFKGNIVTWRFAIWASVITFCLFTIRYTGLYIYFSIGLFYLIRYFKIKPFRILLKDGFFLYLLISGILILGYIIFNYINFGDFMGEKFRNPSDVELFGPVFYHQIISIFNSFNPLFGIKFWIITAFTAIAEIVFFVMNVLFLLYTLKLLKRNRREDDRFSDFYSMLFLLGLVYAILMFVSTFFQGIEALHVRTLCEASLCFFIVLIFLYYKYNLNEKLIFSLAVFSLIFNSLYTVKVPGNFLESREKVKEALGSFKNKKYFLNNSTGKQEKTVYRIPLINKEFSWTHDNIQSGHINGYIVYSLNPEIDMIEKDTARKSETLYNTELEQVIEKQNFKSRQK